MDTRTLINFMAVAEEKNIRRAAMRLHITQPALTRQIQSLEQEIGAPLFIRSTHGMELTAAGQAVLHHACNIQAEVEMTKRDVLRTMMEQRKRFDIGVYGSAIFNIIPDILERFSKANPDVDLVIHSARKEQQIQALRHGKILIAFDRGLQEQADLACEEVSSESMMLALHKDHPLAALPSISINMLRDETFIGGHNKLHDTQFLHGFSFIPRIEQRVDDLLTALALVGCGFGLCFGPPSIQSLNIRNVVYRPFPEGGNLFFFKLQCLYRKNENSSLLQALLEVVRTYRAENFG